MRITGRFETQIKVTAQRWPSHLPSRTQQDDNCSLSATRGEHGSSQQALAVRPRSRSVRLPGKKKKTSAWMFLLLLYYIFLPLHLEQWQMGAAFLLSSSGFNSDADFMLTNCRHATAFRPIGTQHPWETLPCVISRCHDRAGRSSHAISNSKMDLVPTPPSQICSVDGLPNCVRVLSLGVVLMLQHRKSIPKIPRVHWRNTASPNSNLHTMREYLEVIQTASNASQWIVKLRDSYSEFLSISNASHSRNQWSSYKC